MAAEWEKLGPLLSPLCTHLGIVPTPPGPFKPTSTHPKYTCTYSGTNETHSHVQAWGVATPAQVHWQPLLCPPTFLTPRSPRPAGSQRPLVASCGVVLATLWEPRTASGTSLPLLLLSASWPVSPRATRESLLNPGLAKLQKLPRLPKCVGGGGVTAPDTSPAQPLPTQALLPGPFFAKAVPAAGNVLPCILHLAYSHPLHEGPALPGRCGSDDWHVITYTQRSQVQFLGRTHT